MGFKSTPFPWVIGAILVLGPIFASAHRVGQENNSLADLAREQRLKNKEERQPATMYTNDNLPLHSPAEATAPFVAVTLAGFDSKASGSKPHDEEYFRSGINRLRANLESHKQGLVSLQDEMNKHVEDGPPYKGHASTDIRWTTDPIRTYKFWMAEDQRLRTGIDSQERKIASDEKDISDFIDQCRRENCEPGWIR